MTGKNSSASYQSLEDHFLKHGCIVVAVDLEHLTSKRDEVQALVRVLRDGQSIFEVYVVTEKSLAHLNEIRGFLNSHKIPYSHIRCDVGEYPWKDIQANIYLPFVLKDQVIAMTCCELSTLIKNVKNRKENGDS